MAIHARPSTKAVSSGAMPIVRRTWAAQGERGSQTGASTPFNSP